MPTEPPAPTPEHEPEIPAGLAQGLRELYGRTPAIPSHVNTQVMARAELTRRTSPRGRRKVHWLQWTCAAAFGLAVMYFAARPKSSSPLTDSLAKKNDSPALAMRQSQVHEADAEAEGGVTLSESAKTLMADAAEPAQVTIVDALRLSLLLHRSQAPGAGGASQEAKSGPDAGADLRWDLNRDGRVDDQDVVRVAQLAVAAPMAAGRLEESHNAAAGAPAPRAREGAKLKEERSPAAPAVRFETIEIMIDSGESPLGAYQVLVTASAPDDLEASVTLLGVDGGEAAFASPPFFDPASRAGSVWRVAAIARGAAPTGRARAASLRVQAIGGEKFAYSVALEAAADPQGRPIDAAVSLRVTP